MKKSVLISLIALGVSLVGLLIALAAWLHKKKELDCDDFDDDLLMDDDDSEYIAAQYIEHANSSPSAQEDGVSDGYAEEDYADLVEELRGDGSTSGIVSLQLSNASIELDSTPNSWYMDFYVTMDRYETYRRSWSDDLGEDDYELTVYCNYEKDGDEWKLSDLPVNSYDF